MAEWNQIFIEPAKIVLSQIGNFVVYVLLVVIILIVGWMIAKLIKAGVTKGLRAVKLDEISDQIEFDALLAKGGITYSLSELIGVICYWLAILVTFVIAINAVGLTVTASLLNDIIKYVPNIIVAIFILIVGMFTATVLGNIVKTTTVNAGVAQTNMLTNLSRFVVYIFAAFMALEQLQIGVRISEITLSIVLGSIGLAAALAFGLGCKDIAGKFIGELVDKMKK